MARLGTRWHMLIVSAMGDIVPDISVGLISSYAFSLLPRRLSTLSQAWHQSTVIRQAMEVRHPPLFMEPIMCRLSLSLMSGISVFVFLSLFRCRSASLSVSGLVCLSGFV